MSRLNVAFSVDVSPDRNWLAAFMFNSPREGACLVLAFFWRIAPTSRGGFSSSLRNLEKTLLIYSLPISRMEGMEKSEDTWAKRFFPGISKEISPARKETFSSSFEKSGSPRNLEKTLLIYSLPILRMGGMEKSEDTWAKRFFPGISKEISPARKETFSSSFEKSGREALGLGAVVSFWKQTLEKALLIYSLPVLRLGGMEKSEDTWAKRFFPGISKEISPARKETFSSSF